jgi:dUTP pyrophosphatase
MIIDVEIARPKKLKIKFKLLYEDAQMPVHVNQFAAGLDFVTPEDIILKPGESKSVPLGIAWQPDRDDVYLQLKSRSGLAFKKGIEASNAGVIDSDYRGEIHVLLKNSSKDEVTIKKGERCCQGIALPVFKIDMIKSEALSATERGSKGFGSTGA